MLQRAAEHFGAAVSVSRDVEHVKVQSPEQRQDLAPVGLPRVLPQALPRMQLEQDALDGPPHHLLHARQNLALAAVHVDLDDLGIDLLAAAELVERDRLSNGPGDIEEADRLAIDGGVLNGVGEDRVEELEV